MKRLFLFIILFNTSLVYSQDIYSELNNKKKQWVDSIYNSLSLEEKIAQLFINWVSPEQSDFEEIKNKANSLDIALKIGGAGYLFDQVSNKLTLEILYGLIFAILSIGFLFVLINRFNLKYFFVALAPNILPILVTIGILCFFGFYFSLSNAFIFAIVFGLIVDDSIHILSSYRFNISRGMDKELAISNSMNITARAVIKTTIVVIVSLLPLLLSEFKSVSQLSIITIVSAVIAIVFDLLYLPKLIKKFL